MINDLFDYSGLKIFQDNKKFKFALDSILLAEFVELNKKESKIVDFCTGNAPVPLILSTKTKNQIWGIEIQKRIYELGKKSVGYNKLEDQITLINDNVLHSKKYFSPATIDIVTCNPPYFKKHSGIINGDYEKAIARHEITISLEDIIKSAASILKNKGLLYMIHRPERLEELSNTLNQYNFKIKKLVMVHSSLEDKAIAVLIKAVKNGSSGLIVEKPLIIDNMQTYQNAFRR